MDNTLQNPPSHECPATLQQMPQGQSQHSRGKDMMSSTEGHAVTASGDGGTLLERAQGSAPPRWEQGCLLLCHSPSAADTAAAPCPGWHSVLRAGLATLNLVGRDSWEYAVWSPVSQDTQVMTTFAF